MKKHYQKHTKLYSVWNQMRNRCNNPNDKSYARYGGKGISVCDEWSDFRVFYPWAMENGYVDGLTLDRIDPRGNYEPNNCRWITMTEQQRNRGNNVLIEHDGEFHTIAEWCEMLGESYTAMKSRYYRLMKKNGTASFEDVFTQKTGFRHRKIAQYSMDGELIKVWDKLADVERAGFEHGSISLCCQGRLKKTQGYRWKYYE